MAPCTANARRPTVDVLIYVIGPSQFAAGVTPLDLCIQNADLRYSGCLSAVICTLADSLGGGTGPWAESDVYSCLCVVRASQTRRWNDIWLTCVPRTPICSTPAASLPAARVRCSRHCRWPCDWRRCWAPARARTPSSRRWLSSTRLV